MLPALCSDGPDKIDTSKQAAYSSQSCALKPCTYKAQPGWDAHIWAAVGNHPIECGEQEGKGAQPSEQQEGVKYRQVYKASRCQCCQHRCRAAPAQTQAGMPSSLH